MDWSHIVANERPKDDRDIQLGSVFAPAAIPASFIPDLSWFIRNFQGKTFFCGEHAGTHLKAILDFNEVSSAPAPWYTPRYGAIKLKDPKSPVCDGFAINAGTDMRSIFKWLEKVGADTFQPLENDVALPAATYCDPSAVTPAMDANAATSMIASYGFGATDYASLCQYIYQSKAVLLLIKCDDGFWGTTTPTFTTPIYGHFIVAFGYDETGIYVLDSAEPNDALAIKHIARSYITPTFILESGTAVDIPPSVKQIATTPELTPEQKTSLIQTILGDIEQAVGLIKQELGSI